MKYIEEMGDEIKIDMFETPENKLSFSTFILKQIKNNDILGLGEILESKKYFSTVKCISQSCEFYKLTLEVISLTNYYI